MGEDREPPDVEPPPRTGGEEVAARTTFAGTAADALRSATTLEQPLRDDVSSRIGPYRLMQILGEGGFGTVFLAEQSEPVRRRVALKLIKKGMDSSQVLARFDQERQALALMDHPSIAKVLDAGTTDDGQPFFVMELVPGEPITLYCDRHQLSIEERIGLFSQVCSAVQHAHTKGVIHRDIKPSNVLVTAQDGAPRAKVIDFGIAKATSGNLTERTFFTEHRLLLGTPEYMSPEQAEGSLDIDTRTDVYALGVLLYELLTGSTPFDGRELRAAALSEVLRIIREVEPPSPSSRLSESTATLATIASRRHSEPRKLSSTLRGELDWIVMKALEKDRQRRYDSPAAFAADVERYLAGEAVSAAPPSAAYRVRKFVGRYRVPVAAAGLAAAALLVAVVGISWQAKRARAERDKAQRIAAFMGEMLEGVAPSVARGRDTTMLQEMMTAAAERIRKGELAGSPEAELHLRGTIGSTFRELALYDEAAAMLEPALPLARSLAGGDRPETAQALADLAQLKQDRGDLDAAGPLYDEALAMRRRLFRGDHAEVATDLNNLASYYQDRGDLAAAEKTAREALEMRRRLFSGDHIDLAESLNNVAVLVGGPQGRGDLDGAIALFREALAMNRRLFPGDHPRVAGGINNLSVLLKHKGDLAGAEEMARETLDMRRRLFPGDHPYVATALGNLALLVQARGDLAAPEAMFRESLAMRRRLYPDGHASIALDLHNLARLLLERGDAAGAEPIYRESVAAYVRAKGGDYSLTGVARLGLGRTLTQLRRFGEAESELVAAEKILSTAQGVPPGRLENCLEAMVELYGTWSGAGERGRRDGAAAAERLSALRAKGPAKSAA